MKTKIPSPVLSAALTGFPKPPPTFGLTREYTEWRFEQMVRERWPLMGRLK